MSARLPSDEEFGAFVAEVEPRLRRALIATLGSTDGRQATVDALSWAWEHWTKATALDHPAAYLYRVGRTAFRRHAPRPIPFRVIAETAEVEGVDPEIVAALSALPEQQRVTVMLVHAFGWSQRETATMLGVTPSTVQAHLARAMQRLRSTLEVHEDAG